MAGQSEHVSDLRPARAVLARHGDVSDPDVRHALMEKGEDWKVEGQTLAEELEKHRLWKGRIRFPGEPKRDTVLSSSGVAGSLKQTLATPFFSQISTQNRLRVLEAYWEGIERVIPEVLQQPTDYALQKSTGVMIMHSLLIPVCDPGCACPSARRPRRPRAPSTRARRPSRHRR